MAEEENQNRKNITKKEKISPSIFVYRINDDIFIRDNEKIFEFKDIENIEQVIFFINKLTKGLDIISFKDGLGKKEKDNFLQIYDFLKKNNFLVECDCADCKEHGEIRKQPLKIKITSKDKNFSRILNNIALENGLSEIVETDMDDYDLLIFVKEKDTNEDVLKKINLESIKNHKIWLLVDLSIGNYASIGPLVRLGGNPCYECFVERKKINNDILTIHEDDKRVSIKEGVISFLPFQYSFVSSILTDYILNLSKEEYVSLDFNSIIYIDLNNFKIWKESLLKYPNCSICKKL